MKIAGRESGKKCIVVDLVDKNFVLVTGPPKLTGVKRRRSNIVHLEAIGERFEIKKGASDEEVTKAIEKARKTDFMKAEVGLKTAAVA